MWGSWLTRYWASAHAGPRTPLLQLTSILLFTTPSAVRRDQSLQWSRLCRPTEDGTPSNVKEDYVRGTAEQGCTDSFPCVHSSQIRVKVPAFWYLSLYIEDTNQCIIRHIMERLQERDELEASDSQDIFNVFFLHTWDKYPYGAAICPWFPSYSGWTVHRVLLWTLKRACFRCTKQLSIVLCLYIWNPNGRLDGSSQSTAETSIYRPLWPAKLRWQPMCPISDFTV